jgi:TIR domain
MATVFFSYSHKDEPMRDDLEVHLAALKRQGVIETWHDRRILAGDEWEGKISDNLERADIILLLVSPYFLASEYCNDVEVARALQRHEAGEARVIPVILEPCDWQRESFGRLQSATKDGKPISKYPNKHDAFLEVVHAIRAVMSKSQSEPARRQLADAAPKATPDSGAHEVRSSNLRIKKTLTDHDRDSFRDASFEYIANFFEGSLAELQNRNDGITSSPHFSQPLVTAV